MKREARFGFTLIELLVVIAIIAILAAILFPVFARAREKARETTCLSNVKEISLGTIMYVQDYDGRYPLHNYVTDHKYFWPVLVWPYIGQAEITGWTGSNYGIFECPSGPNPAWYWGAYSDYGFNVRLNRDIYGLPSEAEVEYPAMTVMIGETQYYHSSKEKYYGWYMWYSFTSGASRWDHNERANYGFCDGHAKGGTRQAMIGSDFTRFP